MQVLGLLVALAVVPAAVLLVGSGGILAARPQVHLAAVLEPILVGSAVVPLAGVLPVTITGHHPLAAHHQGREDPSEPAGEWREARCKTATSVTLATT